MHTGSFACRWWTIINLLDERCFVTSDNKTEPGEGELWNGCELNTQEGKFPKELSIQCPSCSHYSGWGRKESWQGKDTEWDSFTGRSASQPQRSLTFNNYYFNSAGKFPSLLFKLSSGKTMIELFCIILGTVQAHSTFTAHRMLMRRPTSPISKSPWWIKCWLSQVSSVGNVSHCTQILSFQNEGLT